MRINYLSEPLFYPPPVIQQKDNEDTDRMAVVGVIIALVSVGIIYLAWILFVKDCIPLYKAKKQRTTTEIGFGQTPQHRGGVVRNNGTGNGENLRGPEPVM